MKEPEKTFDYIEEAHVTASGSYHGDRVSLGYFRETIAEAVAALVKLDAIKKTLFYGRDCGVPAPGDNTGTLAKLPDWIATDGTDEANARAVNIVHAIIGKATEAGELLEALSATAEGAVFDDVNALEEVGDGFWYDALLLRAIGSNFGEAQAVNIAKLRKRFPQKFTEHDANNRDLFEERKILEQKA
ncbi:MazG-like pyrophosphatase [Stenotrophomonas phage vB_SmaS_Bhz58]